MVWIPNTDLFFPKIPNTDQNIDPIPSTDQPVRPPPGIGCERSEQKICAFFKYFHVKLLIPEEEYGISSGAWLLMWKFYWGRSKSVSFEWGLRGYFVIFNGVIFGQNILVGWGFCPLGWKNRPFLEIFSTGVASGVDPPGSQRQGCLDRT